LFLCIFLAIHLHSCSQTNTNKQTNKISSSIGAAIANTARSTLVANYPLDVDGNAANQTNVAVRIAWSNNADAFVVDAERGAVFHADVEGGKRAPRCLTTNQFQSVKIETVLRVLKISLARSSISVWCSRLD
jgi:hypothetical protein